MEDELTSTINFCKSCQLPLGDGNAIAFADSYYHFDCFHCSKCQRLIEHDTRILVLPDGNPVCEGCSCACNACGKPILDEAIMTGDMSFHEECFKCYKCGNIITDLVFTNTKEGISCTNCTKTINVKPSTTSSMPVGPVSYSQQPSPTLASPDSFASSTFAGKGLVDKPQTAPVEGSSSSYVAEELRQTKERLRTTENALEKIKNASKTAVDEFKKVKEELAKETAIREKAEKAVWLLKAELDKKNAAESLLLAEIQNLRAQSGYVEKSTGSLSEVESVKAEVLALEQKKFALEQQNADLTNRQESMMADFQQHMESDQRNLANEISRQKSILGGEVEELAARKAALEHELDELKTERATNEGAVNKLSEEKSRLEATIPAMQDTYQKLSVELSKLEKQRNSAGGAVPGETVRGKKGPAFGSSLSSLFTNEAKGSRGNLLSAPLSPTAEGPMSPVESFATSFRESNASKVNLNSSSNLNSSVPLSFKWVSSKEKPKHMPKQHNFQPQSYIVPTKCASCAEKIWGVKSKELQCKDCNMAVHSKCLQNIVAECHAKDDEVEIPPLFGSDLFEECEMEERSVPIIVQRCVEELEKRGLDFEGIYRKSGLQSQIRSFIDAHNTSKSRGADVDISSTVYPDPNVVTGALKQYFRSMPTPLTTYELYAELVQGAMEQDSQAKIKILVKALASLPVPNYETLRYLMVHLNKVASMEDKNKMSPRNLAVVFGPNLIRSPASAGAEMNGEVDADMELSDMGYKNAVIDCIISNASTVFKLTDEIRSGKVPELFQNDGLNVKESQKAIEDKLKKRRSSMQQQAQTSTVRARSASTRKNLVEGKREQEIAKSASMMNSNSYVLVSNEQEDQSQKTAGSTNDESLKQFLDSNAPSSSAIMP